MKDHQSLLLSKLLHAILRPLGQCHGCDSPVPCAGVPVSPVYLCHLYHVCQVSFPLGHRLLPVSVDLSFL